MTRQRLQTLGCFGVLMLVIFTGRPPILGTDGDGQQVTEWVSTPSMNPPVLLFCDSVISIAQGNTPVRCPMFGCGTPYESLVLLVVLSGLAGDFMASAHLTLLVVSPTPSTRSTPSGIRVPLLGRHGKPHGPRHGRPCRCCAACGSARPHFSPFVISPPSSPLPQASDCLSSGDVGSLMDPTMDAPADAVLCVAQLALSCTAERTAARPSMAHIANELQAIREEWVGKEELSAAVKVDAEVQELKDVVGVNSLDTELQMIEDNLGESYDS
ncbi:unnamed protein product [Closterium sp. Yama58-4]|nr:unnamed protein product [Closterium sp. Yama58-4]